MNKKEYEINERTSDLTTFRDSGSSIWDNLKEANRDQRNNNDIQKQMSAFGYSKGEIEDFLKTKVNHKKQDKIEEIKEEMYIRHKLRYRLLMEHVRDTNLLITLENMRLEDEHLIDSLIKLGEIAPVQQGPNNVIQALGIEQFVYSAFKEDTGKAPVLKEAPQIIEDVPYDDEGREDTSGTN
jgi:hypothetical protein